MWRGKRVGRGVGGAQACKLESNCQAYWESLQNSLFRSNNKHKDTFPFRRFLQISNSGVWEAKERLAVTFLTNVSHHLRLRPLRTQI